MSVELTNYSKHERQLQAASKEDNRPQVGEVQGLQCLCDSSCTYGCFYPGGSGYSIGYASGAVTGFAV